MASTYFQRFLVFIISICAIASTAYAESGRTDYDLDDDGLIEINSLADLNEIRNNLDGTTLYGESGGCPAEGCNGFELTTTLDFDTNADGVMDENDEYWNNGEGWEPIGDSNSPFTAIFDGNGHQIRNLYIDRPTTDFVGLFGNVEGETASLRNLGLTGKLMSVTADDYVGGLVGGIYNGSLSDNFATGIVVGGFYVGGLAGYVGVGSFSDSFATGHVTGYYYVGGLVGGIYNGSLSNSFATARVTGEYHAGGLVGHSNSYSIMNSHWATDTSGQASSVGASSSNNYFGATLAELQCPNSSDNTECVISNTLYASWDAAVWDFGSNQELPGLIMNGVVYRDSDSDGLLDDEDAFPNHWAASADDDSDGHPDAWKAECDTECILSSGLTLDQFPATSAAWLDADLDGYPDSWASGCDASCQNDSGLTLDTSLNDVDNDGVIDIQDSDTNGVLNADADSNGLIEVSTLEQLNSVRYNLTGTGRTLTEAGKSDSSGCPVVIFEGTLQRVCAGYELTTTLDFDTNADGVMDASDTYWSDGEGWESVGDDDLPFTGTFDGNGHQIRNLYIDRPTTDYVGLFGYVQGETASLSNLGLTGKLMSVTGDDDVGGLVGRADEASITQSYSTGATTGDYRVGGLVGQVYYASLSNSFATGSVIGRQYAGGLVGYVFGGSLSNNFATGSVTADVYTGGLLGYIRFPPLLLSSHWAIDTTGQAFGSRGSSANNYFGATLAELQCPISSDNTECVISNTLYASWDASVWDFGSSQELPGLIINGVVYRDRDGDGALDGDDAFPNNRAGSVDNDDDGYPDNWTTGCDAQCRSTSGLTLDQFPATGAAWLDADLDGYPDSWAAGCDASCQNHSGLILDTSINDVDNDGIIDSEDSDINGVLNADADSNGLIDVSTLKQLNAVRYNLNGTGRTLTEAGDSDSSGCPAVIVGGVLQHQCSGYELTTSLDFDVNADGIMDANDTYWNGGEGWEPIGDQNFAFNAIFDGNGHQIRNLFIDRPTTNYVGLFGYVKGDTASLSNLGLTGKLMSVTGDDDVGGLVGYLSDASVTQSYSTGAITGYVYVGGLVGKVSGGSLSDSFATGSVTGNYDTGGLLGGVTDGSLSDSFATGSVSGDNRAGGLVGRVTDGSLSHSFATGNVNGNSSVGGLIGHNGGNSFSVINSHWATDMTGQAFSEGETDADNYFGATLAELQCPISSDNTECVISNTLYASWDATVWNFGSNQELPGLIIEGVFYRDSDGDGSLDGDDAFPNNRAGSVDNDDDGYPDNWTTGCDAQCRSTSGLTLDQFPATSAAWLDADLDGYPDSWASGCDASCQNDSGLTLDTSLNDVDNDGIIDSEDSDINGVLNADADSNGLIDVSTLKQLNAVRYNLNGTGRTLTEAGDSDSSGCPAVIVGGVLQHQCSGYELTTSLDFDVNADGIMDANDTYWNGGEGWEPIGDQNFAFNAIFDGNGHQIRNLFIDRPSTDYVGLFGYVKGEAASLRNLGLTGKLMSVAGDYSVGGLAGYVSDASITRNYSTGVVTGDDNVGGLVGGLYSGALNHSFATGSVTGNYDTGGLLGAVTDGSLSDSFATGSVTGNGDVGGLVGYVFGGSLSNIFATGNVTDNSDVGGLVGYGYSFSVINSHWATDTSGQASSDGESEFDHYFGATLAELQCPTSSDDIECLISNTLYASWDNSVWDFGANQELPGLIIDGVVYRDSDGDGALDINQAPEVTLVLKQDGDVVPDVIVGAGDVTIEAVITDPDVSDVHTLTWTLSDSSLMGETDNTSASFSSDNIPDGEYTVAVVATDNRYSPLSDDASITFTVERNASSAPENSASSGSSGGGGAFGVFWVLILLGLIRLRNRRGHVLA